MRHIELDIDNQTLLDECKRGDRDAMSILYTRFAPRMLHVISRYVTEHDSAQDILHDGFIAAFTRLDTLRDADRIEFWLATIMKNLSLKYLQAQTVTSILQEIPETAEEQELEDILDFATLETLIRKLPEGYQKVFRLAVLEGKSHKEISEILGIAPNSSSSQLFHAKIRLRELIKDYKLRAGLLSILLLIVSSGILLFLKHTDFLHSSDIISSDATPKKQILQQTLAPESTIEDFPENSSIPSVSHYSKHKVTGSIMYDIADIEDEHNAPSKLISDPDISKSISPIESDSIIETTSHDKQEKHQEPSIEKESNDDFERLFADVTRPPQQDKNWTAGISFDPGLISFNGDSDLADMSSPYPPFDPETPPGPDDEDLLNPAKILRNYNDIEGYLSSSTRQHHLPISFALTAEKRFSSWLGVESGIGYSYLHTDFEHYSRNGIDVSTCQWHYLEIPLKVNLYAYSSHRVKLYFGFGGRLAIPVYSYARMAPSSNIQSRSFSSKAIWSAGGSIGVAFQLSKNLDIFIEPSLHYNFPQNTAIPNIWTDDEPFSISIPLGLRISW
ncbi:MAG: sigma-70 family RNA polymerase sigma factor [Muribaculaceae bacterium]|nr:sigma-70 family RNA polymerase sigma factor [Muribaculaceae bacterium]